MKTLLIAGVAPCLIGLIIAGVAAHVIPVDSEYARGFLFAGVWCWTWFPGTAAALGELQA